MTDTGTAGDPLAHRDWLARWGLPLAGFAGTLLMTLSAQELVARVPKNVVSPWWFRLTFPPAGGPGNYLVFYAGMAAVIAAWIGIGRHLGQYRARQLLLIGALWALPFLFSPPLFSRDMFSYVAQGTLAHLHLSPYKWPATSLVGFGKSQVLAGTSPIWRTTPTPYGPAWLVLSAEAVTMTGGHLVASLVALRVVDIAGVVLAAAFLPRLARLLGADPARALWLGALSPLVLLSLVAAGHNDALMVGLTVAGVTLALEGRRGLGIALCALAAAVKLPGALGVVFIAWSWARSEETPEGRVRAIGTTAVITASVLEIVTWASGFGWGWLSPSAISTETQLHRPFSPTTALGESISLLLRAFDRHLASGDAIAVARVVGLLAAAALVAWLCRRSSWQSMVPALGLSLLAVVVLGPVVLPWYLTWGLVFLAACQGTQDWPALAVMAGGYEVLTAPGGTVFPGGAWVAIPVLLVLVLVASSAWSRRRNLLPNGLEWVMSPEGLSYPGGRRAASRP